MTALGDRLRAKAKDELEAVKPFQNDFANWDQAEQQKFLLMHAQINATIYETVADAVDYLAMHTSTSDDGQKFREAVLKRNEAIRIAAAKGDWETFQKVVAGLGKIIEENDGNNTG
jgi:hypothetical protein